MAKRYDGDSSCPSTATESYGYDQSGHGYAIGQRTMMTNTNAVVSWTYDRRGRVIAETRTVTGMGVYTTRMGYDTANRVVTTTYPTGETITNTYTAAWQPAQLQSRWLALPYNLYAEGTYNVRGQLTTVNHFNQSHTDYAYDDSDGTPSFRLAELKLQRFDTGAQYLKFQYQYDNVGNITQLTEVTNAGQQQCFGYDALDRLTSAFTGDGNCQNYSGAGTAPYSHSGANNYQYDQVGSITKLAGRTYDYVGSGHAHAVRYAYNVGTSGRFDPFTTAPSGWWMTSCGATCSLSYSDGGEMVARHGGVGYATSAYRSDTPALVAGNSIQVEFKACPERSRRVNQGYTQADAALQLADAGGNNVFGLIATPNQNLRVQYKIGGVGPSYVTLSPAVTVQANEWYVLRLEAGNGTTKARLSVWKRSDPGVRAYYEMTSKTWNLLTWYYRSYANTQGTNCTLLTMDSYFELRGSGTSVWSYTYDPNGNMRTRIEAGMAYSQTWDAQNRLVKVITSTITTTLSSGTYTFGYDADGGRVLQVAPNSFKTAYVGVYEETVTPTVLFAQDFEAGTGNWTITGGMWNRYYNASDTYYYKQTIWEQPGESSAVIAPAVTYGEITATARVRLELGTNVMAGLVLRRNTANNAAYFVGIRNIDSGYYCGIYEKSGSTWTNRTPGLTSCKYATGGWRTVMARVAGGRIEMWVDGALKATWADTTPLPAYGFGLMTFDGAASFDNIKVHGLSTRSYYMFGSARVAERTTTHGQAAGSSTGASGGARYVLHSDHLGSVSLATNSSGVTVTNSLARFFPFGAERGAAPSGSPTDFSFTGQRGSTFGLIHMGARWYDSSLARWVSADTIIPNSSNPQALNRFAYVYNGSLRHRDSTGHFTDTELKELLGSYYDTLMELWGKYDSYWMRVLEALTIHDHLVASEFGDDRYLAFEPDSEGHLRAMLHQKDGTKIKDLGQDRLWNWQGQGVYTVGNDTLSDPDARGYNRDALFGDGPVIQPVFHYWQDNHGFAADYRGARLISQHLGATQYTTALEELILAAGGSNSDVGGISALLQGVMAFKSPTQPIAVIWLTIDMGVSVGKTYNAPKDYYIGWPGFAEEVSPRWLLEQCIVETP